MSIEQFVDFLQKTDIYEEIMIKKVKYPELEKLNGFFIAPVVFERLVKQLGRIPTQREFIYEGFKDAAEFFLNPDKLNDKNERWLKVYNNSGKKEWHNFEWNEKLKLGIIQRVARSYPSMTAEYTTKKMLEHMYPEWQIIDDTNVDRVLGADLTVITKKDEVFYIHITKNTNWSRNLLKQKSTYDGRIYKDGKPIYFKRDFDESHITLFYDDETSNNTIMYRSIVFLKKLYMEQRLLSVEPEPLESSQLKRFNEWLISHDLEPVI